MKLKSPKRSHHRGFSPASLVDRHLIVAFNKIKLRENTLVAKAVFLRVTFASLTPCFKSTHPHQTV